jgi:ABC-2 type transport system permease protein
MIKLMKYEYRRNLAMIVAMLGSLSLLECFYLYATYKKDVNLVIPATMLMVFAASMCVLGMLIYSVALYSRELNSKTSYLTFMTPNTPARILGAKLLAALLLGFAFALIISALAAWDIALLTRTFPEIDLVRVIMEEVLRNMAATDLATILTTVAAMGISFLINFFTFVVVAYLAITLSATVLQNAKLKKLAGFVFFVAIQALLQWGVSHIPVDYSGRDLTQALLAAWPQHAVYLAVIVASFALSAWLLEKKVSL